MVIKKIKNWASNVLNKKQNTSPDRLNYTHHRIDKKLVSKNAIKVCEVLQQHGYQAYIVGGAVRDLIAKIEPKDFDVVTNATPEQIRKLFRRARIIGKRFRLVHVVFGREIIETSTYRAPSNSNKHTDKHGRIINDNLFGTQEQDAARRDFTLNALYYDPITEVVVDFHNGVKDIQNKTIRMIGDPITRYREDPVRMLRAMRFAAKLNATLEPTTLAPIKELAGLIKNVPDSRLVDELIKALTCGNAMQCIDMTRSVDLHSYVMPLLDQTLDLEDGKQFIELAFDRTDNRIRSGKTISPSYLFASLLWPLTNKKWHELINEGEFPSQALAQAADLTIHAHINKLPLQKRFTADMREIWFMQLRFERATPRAIYRMLEQPRFRAAVDFLQMRAAAKQVDSVMAQWWMDLADADDNERHQLIQAIKPQRRNPKRRKKRKKSYAKDND